MWATPLNNYLDNPSDNLNFLQTLDDRETQLYTMGYVQACYQVMEALGDSKRRFLSAAMPLEQDDPMQSRLLGFVKLLDSLDTSLIDRVAYLRKTIIDA